MDPLTLMLVGTGMKMLGDYGANIQQKISEAANAKFFQDQLNYNIASMENDLRTVNREYGYKVGQAITTGAASGLDVGSGSALTNTATLLAEQLNELEFVRKKGEMEIKISRLRMNQSQAKADMLGSTSYNLTQAATTGFTHLLQAQKDPFVRSDDSDSSYTSYTSSGGTGLLGANTQF